MSSNMIKNAGFEKDSDKDGLADNWNSVGGENDRVAFGIDTYAKGKFSQRMSMISSRMSKTGEFFGIASDRFILGGKGNIKLRAILKAENVSMLHMLIYFYDLGGRSLTSEIIPGPLGELDESDTWDWNEGYNVLPFSWKSGSWDWKQWQCVLCIPSDAVKAEVHFLFCYSGTLWVSNMFSGLLSGELK